jgi:hypothetical protein
MSRLECNNTLSGDAAGRYREDRRYQYCSDAQRVDTKKSPHVETAGQKMIGFNLLTFKGEHQYEAGVNKKKVDTRQAYWFKKSVLAKKKLHTVIEDDKRHSGGTQNVKVCNFGASSVRFHVRL